VWGLFNLLSLAFCTSQSSAQQLDLDDAQTYALVVGISNYADEDIDDLRFAHRDAEVFAEYLKSKAGGSLPAQNIRLLTNEKATLAAIDDAFNWLLKVVKDGDEAIIFFSGHGDVEKQTPWQLGFLLAYNTPYNNYRNQAVRLEDLNYLSLTLTVNKNARMVIILDACRSGKLAGQENQGPSLTADQASKREANEIRIMSCKSGQESWESEDVGGGRGVFSYYLINGLKGQADGDTGDGKVSLEELSKFIKPKVRQDAVRLSKGKKNQDPVLIGDDMFSLAKVDQPTLLALQNAEKTTTAPGMAVASAAPATGAKGMGSADESDDKSVIEEYFDLALSYYFLEKVDFTKIYTLSREETVASVLSEIDSHLLIYGPLKWHDSAFLEEFRNLLQSSGDWKEQFEQQLAIALHDIGQEVLNLYLKSDTAEIYRRRYYSKKKADYDNYAAMFATAKNLIDKDHPSYHKLDVKEHYFKGLDARIRVPTTKDPTELLRTAKAEQLKALALDDKAAYIHNELGIIYKYQEDFANSEKHYLIAADLSPTWALPWSNLCGLYLDKKDFAKAKTCGEKARALQPDFSCGNNNLGRTYEAMGDYLRAEELYLKSTLVDVHNYYPFERLGFVYLQTTRYAQSDTFFYEAEIRKQGLYTSHEAASPRIYLDSDADGVVVGVDLEPLAPDDSDTSVLAEFQRGMIALGNEEWEEAERRFRNVIKMEPSHPLVYHHFGNMVLQQDRKEEAEILLKYSLEYYLPDSLFEKYLDSLRKEIRKHPKRYSLPADTYKKYTYSNIGEYYTLASMYRDWRHYEEAEQAYQDIIDLDSTEQPAYQQLWDLYEQLQRYNEAELLMETYASIWEKERYEVFHRFYERMVSRFPEKADWYYKMAILEYEDDNNSDDDGMAEFKKVLELEPEHPARADINIKIGSLHLDRGEPDMAALHYEKAIAFTPDHASPRHMVADVYHDRERFQNALVHLEFLYKNGQINYPHRLRLAEYLVHSSRFAEADSLVREALEYDPQSKPEKYDLLGRSALMSARYVPAIEQYQKVLNLIGPRKWTREEINEETWDPRSYLAVRQKANELTSYCVQYSIARATAKMGNEKQALTNLEKALAYGFPFYWVLKYDDTWNSLRDNDKWNDMMEKYLPESSRPRIEGAEKNQY
jgi:tetratricopeptide (TPR) repeat protein